MVGASAITLILLLATGMLRNLPQPTLAAVVIAASISLADVPGTLRLYRLRRTEFALSIAAFVGVVVFGVLPGILVAVALSIGNVFRRAGGRTTVLGRFRDFRVPRRGSYPDAERLRGCVIFRFDGPLFFANARTFREQIHELARSEPLPSGSSSRRSRYPFETSAADMLHAIDEGLNAGDVSLVFAEMKDPVRGKLDRYELTRTIDASHFFPTLKAAVLASWRRRAPSGSRPCVSRRTETRYSGWR